MITLRVSVTKENGILVVLLDKYDMSLAFEDHKTPRLHKHSDLHIAINVRSLLMTPKCSVDLSKSGYVIKKSILW